MCRKSSDNLPSFSGAKSFSVIRVQPVTATRRQRPVTSSNLAIAPKDIATLAPAQMEPTSGQAPLFSAAKSFRLEASQSQIFQALRAKMRPRVLRGKLVVSMLDRFFQFSHRLAHAYCVVIPRYLPPLPFRACHVVSRRNFRGNSACSGEPKPVGRIARATRTRSNPPAANVSATQQPLAADSPRLSPARRPV
jgi:hypothetical protein